MIIDLNLNNDVKNKVLTIEEANRQLLTPSHLKVLKDLENLKPKSYEDILTHFNFDIKIIGVDNCGGYMDEKNKEIVVGEDHIDTEFFNTVISHELGHVIQLHTDDMKLWSQSVLLSDAVRLEQQCEVIANRLHQLLFNTKYEYSYFDNSAILFLSEYLNKYKENDLMIKNWGKDLQH